MKERYYVAKSENETIVPFDNKREFLEIFSEQEAELKGFLKKNKTKFKEDADVLKAINFLEELSK